MKANGHMSATRKGKEDSLYLEVQPGINIHYKVLKAVTTFRKPQKKSGSDINQVRRCASSSYKEDTDTQNKFDLIRLSDAARKLSVATEEEEHQIPAESEAECELDVPDGMEELGDRSPGRKPTNFSKQSNENKPIIFILLHSFLGCAEQWDKVSLSLRQYGTVISFDR